MINGIKLKICGITSLADAAVADAVGADYLGFIFYSKSPRGISHFQFKAMKEHLPSQSKVAVSVEPTLDDLVKQAELGFDFFQIHFNLQTSIQVIESWAKTVGQASLWLAPRLPPGIDVYPELLPWAETFLLDTFHPDKLGGTGETGDWTKFKRHREAHPAKHWILSGGLNANNVAEAVSTTDARWLDVNSGVEESPGIKSPEKMQAFALALHNASKRDKPKPSGPS